MKKTIAGLAVLLLLGAVLSGCSRNEVSAVADSKPVQDVSKDKFKVGFVVSTLLNPFFVDMKDGVVSEAQEYGYDLIVLDSRDSSEIEQENVRRLIEESVDVILINPTESVNSIKVIETCEKEGVPVITIDRRIKGDLANLHISSDNYAGGRLAGYFIEEQLAGHGQVVELLGLEGVSVDEERGQGFQSVVMESELEIVHQIRADFDRAKAQVLMTELLSETDEIDAVFAHNDEMALGALKAVTLAGRDVLVVGFDGSSDAIVAVQDGSMGATIAQMPKELGREGIRAVKDVVSGGIDKEEVLVPLRMITALTE